MVEMESIGRCRRWRNSNLLDLWWSELVKKLYNPVIFTVSNYSC